MNKSMKSKYRVGEDDDDEKKTFFQSNKFSIFYNIVIERKCAIKWNIVLAQIRM